MPLTVSNTGLVSRIPTPCRRNTFSETAGCRTAKGRGRKLNRGQKYLYVFLQRAYTLVRDAG